eukprot:gene23423-6717_t
MLLLWAATWRYVAVAAADMYRPLRLDTDIWFTEDPYPLLNGPLLNGAAMVVQNDLIGLDRPRNGTLAWTGRPLCAQEHRVARMRKRGIAPYIRLPGRGCGSMVRPNINIGFVLLRSAPGGAAWWVVNETWGRVWARLDEGVPPGSERAKLKARELAQELLDQTLFRTAAAEAAEAWGMKEKKAWVVIPGDAAPVYGEASGGCPHGAAGCRHWDWILVSTDASSVSHRPMEPYSDAHASKAKLVTLPCLLVSLAGLALCKRAFDDLWDCAFHVPDYIDAEFDPVTECMKRNASKSEKRCAGATTDASCFVLDYNPKEDRG